MAIGEFLIRSPVAIIYLDNSSNSIIRIKKDYYFERRKLLHMATQLRPLHDRVVVKRVEEKEQVKGGIIIPDTAKEKPQEGEVMAVGQGKVLESGVRLEMTLKVGDRILFGKYSGNEVKIDGEELLIMREDDVLGVIEG